MDNRGFALLVSVIIMLLLSSLGIFSVSLLSTDTHISLDTLSSAQAFFIAEAGIQQVIYKLKNESAYRDNPSSVTENIGEGGFFVTISKADTTYTLISTGTVGEVGRRITQIVEVEEGGSPGFLDYVIFFGGGDGTSLSCLWRDSEITGDIFINGDMYIGMNSTVEGSVTATGDITLSPFGGITITEGTFPDSDPPEEQPDFDTSYYDREIQTAASEPAGDQNISGEISGATYVHGDVTINGNLTGSGAIVATGNIEIDAGRNIGDGITLISGDTLKAKWRLFRGGVTIGSNCLLYATNQVTLIGDTDIGQSGQGNGSVVLSDGGIFVGPSADIYGFVFGDEDVRLGVNADIEGNLAGSELVREGNWLFGSHCDITLNSELVDFASIQGFESSGEATVTLGGWEEEIS